MDLPPAGFLTEAMVEEEGEGTEGRGGAGVSPAGDTVQIGRGRRRNRSVARNREVALTSGCWRLSSVVCEIKAGEGEREG